MTADLTAFLRARLDEDATTPEGVLEWHSPGSRVVMAEGFNEHDAYDSSLKDMLERDDSLMPFGCVAVTDYDADAKYIARHDPARILREVEAKRQLIGIFEIAVRNEALPHPEYVQEVYPPAVFVSGYRAALEYTLRCFAALYADHPDYQADWAPWEAENT